MCLESRSSSCASDHQIMRAEQLNKRLLFTMHVNLLHVWS